MSWQATPPNPAKMSMSIADWRAHHPSSLPSRALIAVGTLLLCSLRLWGEPVTVRHSEGIVHGFLALRTLDGKTIADGDLIQVAARTRVTSRLTFHFRDGSLHDETTVFSQRGRFRLVRARLVQKGPAFPQPIDMAIDAVRGNVTVNYADDHGQQKKATEHMDLPPDLANGLTMTLLKNVNPAALPKDFSFVAATPKPRLVKIALASAGEDRFSTGGQTRRATHYVLKFEIGGLSGLLAPLLGKQPPDSHVWILGGEAPAFIRSEQPLYVGGPVWRIELVSPVWPGGSGDAPPHIGAERTDNLTTALMGPRLVLDLSFQGTTGSAEGAEVGDVLARRGSQ